MKKEYMAPAVEEIKIANAYIIPSAPGLSTLPEF